MSSKIVALVDALLADKAFDADWLRVELDERGASAVISPKANRKQQPEHRAKNLNRFNLFINGTVISANCSILKNVGTSSKRLDMSQIKRTML